jgi:hypothetical protein
MASGDTLPGVTLPITEPSAILPSTKNLPNNFKKIKILCTSVQKYSGIR